MGRLFCRGEAHTVCTPVENGVELHDEDISQDPQGCFRRAGVDGHEAGHADGLTPDGFLHDQENTGFFSLYYFLYH